MDKIVYILVFFIALFFIYWYLLNNFWRKILLLAASLGFISLFNFSYIIYYIVLISFVYISADSIAVQGWYNKTVYYTCLFFLIFNFCFFKYFKPLFDFLSLRLALFSGLESKIPEIVFPLGLSFITFRLIHYLVEVSRQGEGKKNFLDFSLYTLFFPTFLAGPIERYPAFSKQANSLSKPDYDEVSYGLWRILLGLIKKFYISDVLLNWAALALHSPFSYPRWLVIAAIYAIMIKLYMDFSGYVDIAIGISRLFGYKLTENFNLPFIRKNIALFWRSWHISLYTWIRDYVYFPFFIYNPTPLKRYLGPFAVVFIFTLWHKGSQNFLLSGIINGLVLIGWVAFQDLQVKFPRLKSILSHRILTPFSIFLTFSYVCFGTGLLFFTDNLSSAWGIIQRIIT